MRPGDLIETLAKPIAKAFDMSCLDEQGNLKPESTCGKRKQGINNFADAVYDRIWANNKNKKKEN